MSNLREATANRLYGCDCGTPSPPFPSHIIPISVFEEMMYKVAYVAGYVGTKADFSEALANALNIGILQNYGMQYIINIVLSST